VEGLIQGVICAKNWVFFIADRGPAMKNTRIGKQYKERRGEKLERQIRSKARENASSFGQSKRE